MRIERLETINWNEIAAAANAMPALLKIARAVELHSKICVKRECTQCDALAALETTDGEA